MITSLQVLLLVLGLSHTTRAFPRLSRLSQAEWASYFNREQNGPGTYTFGYDVEDPPTGNVQFRQEERHPNGTVTGSYGLLEPDGNVRVVHYVADENGFNARVENSRKPSFVLPEPSSPEPAQPEQPQPELPQPAVVSPPQTEQPSEELISGIESTNTLGQPVQEQHTPPKFTGWHVFNNVLLRPNQQKVVSRPVYFSRPIVVRDRPSNLYEYQQLF